MAIADLGAAMWLGLPASERTAALVNRSLAYRAAGLSSQADTELAAVITYTKNSWSNKTGQAVQPAEIQAARK